MQKLILKEYITDAECEQKWKGKFLTEDNFDILLTEDTDAYTTQGEMLLRFRKNVIPRDVLQAGADAFKGSVELTEGRGMASGGSFKRIRKDGSTANTTVGNFVESGAVGYLDHNAMIHYCRKTAFTSRYFERFMEGVPFVQAVDKLYAELCPEHYARQRNIVQGTNKNYVIADTTFTTVTVNRNFQTAVHKDAGDFQRGFGNLSVYREGTWTGSYFCLPQYRVAVDMQNCDMLFVDVHRWHGNTGFKNWNPAPTPYSKSERNPQKGMYVSEDGKDLRIAFVMYYREYMVTCKSPKEELKDTQMEQGGFLKL